MNTSRPDRRSEGIKNRIKRELSDERPQGTGTSTLVMGFALGAIWLFMVYVLPGQSPWDVRFLVAAICFGAWGIADNLAHRWLIGAAVLRAAVWLFLIAFGAWILLDLLGAF